MAKLQKSAAAPVPLAAQGGGDTSARRAKSGKRGRDGNLPQTPKEWQAFAEKVFPHLTGAPLVQVRDLWLLPPPVSLPPNRLHLLRAGVLAGSAAKNRFEPAHALFMAYGAHCANREELTLSDPRTAAWLRGEEIEAVTARAGWCAVLVDGLPLGGGKVSGGRVKNHYPRALRNLK